MMGNVWEGVEGDWQGNYKGAPNIEAAWIDKNRSGYGVLCSGSRYDNQTHISCTSRHKTKSLEALDHAGFRCVWVKE